MYSECAGNYAIEITFLIYPDISIRRRENVSKCSYRLRQYNVYMNESVTY